MSPAEKWRRIMEPTCLEDYGLSMTLKEIKQVPDAVDFVRQHLPPEKQEILNGSE